MSSRWAAVALIGIGLLGTWLLRELLAGIFTDGVSLNVVGVTAIAVWGVLPVVGVVAITRARDADPDFRGAFSELLRIVSFALLLLMFATLAMMTITRPFEWETLNAEGHCVRRANFMRCEF